MDYFRVGKNRTPVDIERNSKEIILNFKFNEVIKDEVKCMEGARWNPEAKAWVVKNSQHNDFAISNLLGQNVFAPWDSDLPNFIPKRGLKSEGGIVYGYQCLMASHQIARPGSITAAEMGTGKTLVTIEVLEKLLEMWGTFGCWFVAPKVALLSVRRDYRKWEAGYNPCFFTIHEFVKQVLGMNPKISIPPRVLILDEASKYKNEQAKCSQAAAWAADFMREYWKGQQRVILMSGSPAPKSPLDWWHLCRIACPGFLKEGTSAKFRDRVALVKKVQGESGVAYPKILTFKDSDKKCNTCGRLEDHILHKMDPTQAMMTRTGADKEPENQPHPFIAMINEVEKIYTRMDGLVQVTLKKNCLELPEKVYRVIKLPPTKYTKQLAKMLTKTAGTSANALLLLRELSDGFQYQEELVGTENCQYCFDTKQNCSTGQMVFTDVNDAGEPVSEVRECIHCAGKKVFKTYKTSTVECDTPKIQALVDMLDELDEQGRVNIFGAFQGTIDRICATVVKAGWRFIRRDGRGWATDLGTQDPDLMLDYYQRDKECAYDRIAFVGHPASCGMGLNLTAADTSIYFSNSFNAEDRIQSEDRIHRHGSRGANIVDFEHLPVDAIVRENLKKKRELQSITLGEIETAMENADDDELT